MEFQENSNVFINIPKNKLQDFIDEIYLHHKDPKSNRLTPKGAALSSAIERYYRANIPVDYWDKDMVEFQGDKSLINVYKSLTDDVVASYKAGKNYCLVGSHGKGKSMTAACVLKRVVEKGKYSALYVNLVDIINSLTCSGNKADYREALLKADFLVIDEFDARFMGTDNAADLFGRVLEPTLRGRIQNKMPTIICSNQADPTTAFVGQLQLSFKSLMNKFTIVAAVSGKDFRGNK